MINQAKSIFCRFMEYHQSISVIWVHSWYKYLHSIESKFVNTNQQSF